MPKALTNKRTVQSFNPISRSTAAATNATATVPIRIQSSSDTSSNDNKLASINISIEYCKS